MTSQYDESAVTSSSHVYHVVLINGRVLEFTVEVSVSATVIIVCLMLIDSR